MRGIVCPDDKSACATAGYLSEGQRWELWDENRMAGSGKGHTVHARSTEI